MGVCVRVRVCARVCECLQSVKSEVKELLCVMYLYTLVYIPPIILIAAGLDV